MPDRNKFSRLLIATFTTLFIISVNGNTKAIADTTPPVTNVVQTPNSPNGLNGWYVSPVTFELTATDIESGVAKINYRLNGGTWQSVEFPNSLNLVANPSFEIAGSTSTQSAYWEATVIDSNSSYMRDPGSSYVGDYSSRIVATDGTWHAINNRNDFAVAYPYGNMTASAWIRTDGTGKDIVLKMYSVSQDGSGNLSYIFLDERNIITQNTTWNPININFIVNDPNSIGVYMDIGIRNTGTLWIDGVSISEAITSATTTVTISTDRTSHTFEYYSEDHAGNTETYLCPSINCVSFKLDQTPPGGWYDAGVWRNVPGEATSLWVWTRVKDETSGISTLSNRYQIKTELNPEFGRFRTILNCGTAWWPNEWMSLHKDPDYDGIKDTELLTQRTGFCNNNWQICKIIRFYAVDMAGNESYKDFCVNGPWIRIQGKAWVRANNSINMLAGTDRDNTDGVIETGGTNIDFFTSSNNWYVKNVPPPENSNYSSLWSEVKGGKTEITDGILRTISDIYYIEGDLTLNSTSIPGNYNSSIFNQIIFVNGDLTIDNNISTSDTSTSLFIVSGDVNIAKNVDLVSIAILADGDMNTAYDILEGDATPTLVLRGLFHMNKIYLHRTLVGTLNADHPSEDFYYEPKYTIQLKDYFSTGKRNIMWKSIN